MLNLNSSTKVFLCSELIDARWSFDALSGLVRSHFGQNPLSGHLFVFFSRRQDRMKILFWGVP
jgi:transposase